MSGNTRWPLAVSLGLLMSLIASTLPAGAAGGGVPLPTVAQSAPRAADPAFAGALPESYPWVRLAETLTPAVVNVRTDERGAPDAHAAGARAVPAVLPAAAGGRRGA